MNRTVTHVGNAVLLVLTPSGWERARRLRNEETKAIIATRRLEVAELLAGIGAHHLSLAELTRQRLTAGQPRLAESSQQVIESLGRAIASEIDEYALRQRQGVHRR